MVVFGHAEPNGHAVKKQRLAIGLTGLSQVVPGEEDHFVGADLELGFGQNGAVRPAIRVGHSLGNLAV